MKLTVLIFSKGYTSKTFSLIDAIYGIADEIVLMDSSDEKERKLIQQRKQGMKKLKVFYVVPLGYPDPLRMYALKKCRGEWVLLLDVDERLSPKLMGSIRKIINNAKCSAFALRRYEEVKNPSSLPFFYTWQIRLFKRKNVEFKGIPHEQPSVKGTLKKIEQKEYYMLHLSALMSRKTMDEYGEMEKFERLTYELHNKKVMDLLSKATAKSGDAKDRGFGRFVNALLMSYQRITLKKQAQELSNFDYFLYYSMLDLAYYIEEKNVRGILHIIPSQLKHIQQINKWKEDPEAQEVLEISKIINKIGITKFLHLDNERVVENLSRSYNGRGGTALLIELIKKRYESEVKTI